MPGRYRRVQVTTDKYAHLRVPEGAVGYVIEAYEDGTCEIELSDPATGISFAQLVVAGSDLVDIPEPAPTGEIDRAKGRHAIAEPATGSVVSVRPMTSAEFEAWPRPLRVIVHEHAKRFGSLSLDGCVQDLAISWRSELVEPVLRPRRRAEVWVGVDQRAACVARGGTIAASIGLASNLLDIACFDDCVALLCETEVVVFNDDHSIRGIFGISNIPQGISRQAGRLVVTLVDGRHEVIG